MNKYNIGENILSAIISSAIFYAGSKNTKKSLLLGALDFGSSIGVDLVAPKIIKSQLDKYINKETIEYVLVSILNDQNYKIILEQIKNAISIYSQQFLDFNILNDQQLKERIIQTDIKKYFEQEFILTVNRFIESEFEKMKIGNAESSYLLSGLQKISIPILDNVKNLLIQYNEQGLIVNEIDKYIKQNLVNLVDIAEYKIGNIIEEIKVEEYVNLFLKNDQLIELLIINIQDYVGKIGILKLFDDGIKTKKIFASSLVTGTLFSVVNKSDYSYNFVQGIGVSAFSNLGVSIGYEYFGPKYI